MMQRFISRGNLAVRGACAAACLVLAGCSWFQSPAANLTGRLGSSYQNLKAATVSRAAVARDLTTPVDSVCVFPAGKLDGSWPAAELAASATTYPINADGTFSAPLGSADMNWVYLLVDSTAARRDQVVGFVSIGDDGGQTLVQFPTASVKSDIDCGSLTQTGDESVSSTNVASVAGSFTLDVASLREIARRDNVLKAARNNYVNYDPASGVCYLLVPRFNWRGSRSSIDNRASTPGSDALDYEGYYPQFSSNDDAITLASLVSGAAVLELYPPSTVQVDAGAKVYGPAAPLSSAGAAYAAGYGPADGNDIKVSAPEFFAINFKVNDGESRADGFAFKPVETGSGINVPFMRDYAGTWTLKKNGTAIGWFDLSVASPADATGRCALYTPSVKVTTDGSGIISRVDVQFYAWDGSGYTAAADVAALNQLVGQYMLGFMNGSAEEYKYTSSQDSAGMEFSFSGFTNRMRLADTVIQLSYTVAGVNVNFWWE
jgi:hypothetical protein